MSIPTHLCFCHVLFRLNHRDRNLRAGAGRGHDGSMNTFPTIVEFPVHWAEMDALGHVNHARMITWMETARIALFERIGLTSVGRTKQGPILAHISVDYRAPIHYPATVLSKARVSKIGRKSFTMDYEIAHVHAPEVPLATGSTVIVLYDYQAQTTIEIPTQLRESIDALHTAT